MTGCGPDRGCIHSPEEHRGAARIGRAKIAFFERADVHPSPLFKHENVFYRVKKGDLMEALSRRYKQASSMPLRNIEGCGGFHMKAPPGPLTGLIIADA